MPDRMNPAACWPVVLLAVLTVWAFRHELEDALAAAKLIPKETRRHG